MYNYYKVAYVYATTGVTIGELYGVMHRGTGLQITFLKLGIGNGKS